ncbi:low molecular weight protein-tyrosine-phosphatase [Leptospira sp. GIMC2001]|uniref:low molecular weight protein-tyrosine-phosphatase n=1 Tax=Leptospira sp. GIMC2001 TaxID=1513297 RepID=UPI00234A5D45|nr:low molecular weight protein-tyrosine-phosphatase [Leptospira sp. GIMC2001]WCL47705.1 low molecular weight phosphotyrosine protein phosphatase [Leptospira sp. GIMC2001]
MVKVLFVCLGNICRSPAAEGAFSKLVEEKGLQQTFTIDSCGTAGYHIGSLPHKTTREVARLNGIELTHRARQFSRDDFSKFDYILAMDDSNYKDILNLAKSDEDKGKVFLFRTFQENNGGEMSVPDPYYGGLDGFKAVQKIVIESSNGFLEYLIKKGIL